jgi:aminopeptidase
MKMAKNFEKYLDLYADLIINVGLNYKKGQRIRIGALPGRSPRFYTPLEAAPLVRALTAKAYQKGAPLVEVFWGDPELDLLRYKNAPKGSLKEMPTWSVNELLEATKRKDARIYIGGSDPYLFKEVDSSLLSAMQKSRSETFREANEYLVRNPTPWIIILYPTTAWAQAVFPELSPQTAVEKISDYLIKFYRLDKEDPTQYWADHFSALNKRADRLTEMDCRSIHLSSPGTDLKIQLPENHLWKTAVLKDKEGRENAVNMPSEEVFTVPDRMGVDGYVSSTKPFTMGDGFVEGLHLEFKSGKVTKVKADTGEDFVKKTLEIDEGSCRLGELALVPNSSPISQSGVIFHNTLLDENASIHIALGRGIRECLRGAEELSTPEFVAAGGNHSTVHYDFMIGSAEIDVDGYDRTGTVHPLMRKGEWAFDV